MTSGVSEFSNIFAPDTGCDNWGSMNFVPSLSVMFRSEAAEIRYLLLALSWGVML